MVPIRPVPKYPVTPGLPLLSILLLLAALIQWTIIPTPVSSKSIRLAMEDRNEETWGIPNSLSISFVAKKKLIFSRYTRIQRLLLKYFCYFSSIGFIVVFQVLLLVTHLRAITQLFFFNNLQFCNVFFSSEIFFFFNFSNRF